MKRTLQLVTLLIAAITLSACDTLHELVKVPPADYTGNYADTNVQYGEVCGMPRTGEVHLNINTQIAEDASMHTIKLSAVIFDAGADGETITNTAQWTVPGAATNLNSGALEDFGTVNLKKVGDQLNGQVTIFNVECVTPAPDPSQPDTITYGRINVPFTATAN